MKWYVVYTKPRQEAKAAQNLMNQGYEVYYPTCLVEKMVQGSLRILSEALFARYVFVRLNDQSDNFEPIRSTRGVQQLLRFGLGTHPVTVPDALIDDLQNRLAKNVPLRQLFQAGDWVEIKAGPFRGLQGYFEEMAKHSSGEQRAILLLEILGSQQRLALGVGQIQVS